MMFRCIECGRAGMVTHDKDMDEYLCKCGSANIEVIPEMENDT